MTTPSVTQPRQVTLAEVTPMSSEKLADINAAVTKYNELQVLINTMQQSQARDSKRLVELRALEKETLADLEEARKAQSLANAKAAKADAEFVKADAEFVKADAEFVKADADWKAAQERLKASNLKLLATVRLIAKALGEQGTVDNMVGMLCRMVFTPHFQTKPEERQADIGRARNFVENTFGKQLLDSYCEEKWTYFRDKKCLNLTRKAVNDFVLPILNSPNLPKNVEVTADLGGFRDELSFDALIEIVKKAPTVTLIKVDRKFNDEQLNVLAQTVVEAKRKIPLVKFYDASHQEKYEGSFKGRLATTSKPLPPPPSRRAVS